MYRLNAHVGAVAVLYLGAFCSSALAAECHSVGGQLNGEIVKAARHVEIHPNSMTISGSLNGKPSPRQSLPCKTIAKGVYCNVQFQGVTVTVMTNGRRMIETVTDPSSQKELASFAYDCDREMRP